MARLLLSSANLNVSNTHNYDDDPFLLPPPPSPLDPDSLIPIDVHHSNRLVPNFLIAAASVLALSFLLLILFYSLLRICRRRRRRLRRRSLAPQPHPPPPNPSEDLLDDDAPHHVWFIRTVGLDESIIKAIPATAYKPGSYGDCSVCLGEFSDGEIVKLLPKCAHVFHVDCIDAWLRSHVNCPLCRAAVVVDLVGVSGSARIEIGEEDQQVCLDTVDLSNLTDGSSSSSRGGEEIENDLQPIRRSVSMDASSLGMIMLRVGLESADEKLGAGKRQVELRDVEVCKGKDDDLGKLGSELKRTMSSMSGRFFFSRYGRGRSRSASVLPL